MNGFSSKQEISDGSITINSPSLFKNFDFPLNVYAHTLFLNEGRVDYLHYGLFESEQINLSQAQQYSTNLILDRLPLPPSRILEVGAGLGTTCHLLTQQGYQVHSITPDRQQIAEIHRRFATGLNVTQQHYEDLEPIAESYDVILFQESAQYIEPLVIFNKAQDLLPEEGHIFIIDEFALQQSETAIGRLHRLKAMLQLSDRLGFELVEHLDLSSKATPTLKYLLHAIGKHRQQLLDDLDLESSRLDQLVQSNQDYLNKYVSGQFGYALLHFRKKRQLPWRLSRLNTNQMPHMLALFEKIFKHKMTSEMWQWKYGSEQCRAMGVWYDNELIAHYGGMGRSILYFGQPQMAVQIGDVMVDRVNHPGLVKKGPFFQMAATFLEHYIGYGKPYLLGFGFPNDRAMKVAKRHGLYAETGRMVEIAWTPYSRRPLWLSQLKIIDQHNINDNWVVDAINQCWHGMASDLNAAIIGIRDWAYLRDRYLNHPQHHYRIVLVLSRLSRKARGILVLQSNSNGCEIMDMVAPLDQISLLITHTRRIARINGDQRVFCQITHNFSDRFISASGEGMLSELPIRIPANAWSDGPSPQLLMNHWWLMSGDMDFR
ncbi:MAG TPA: GNAT family N-acetyltransferase [Nitrosomonas sp.]|nr:GNAT family N-acetyltransferase [Nitrosomonas sp.]